MFRIECPKIWIENELRAKSTRAEFAETYALIMRDCPDCDWGEINALILTRFSTGGLVWIKKRAHRLLADAIQPGDRR